MLAERSVRSVLLMRWLHISFQPKEKQLLVVARLSVIQCCQWECVGGNTSVKSMQSFLLVKHLHCLFDQRNKWVFWRCFCTVSHLTYWFALNGDPLKLLSMLDLLPHFQITVCFLFISSHQWENTSLFFYDGKILRDFVTILSSLEPLNWHWENKLLRMIGLSLIQLKNVILLHNLFSFSFQIQVLLIKHIDKEELVNNVIVLIDHSLF